METVGNGRKQSETVGKVRKGSETVGNMIRPKLVQPAIFLNKYFRSTQFFFEGPKVSKGKREIALSLGKKNMFFTTKFSSILHALQNNIFFLPSEGAISDCFQPFPLGHLKDLQKKLRCPEILILKISGWTSFGLIMFPIASDRFRPFPFFWTIN